MHSVRHGITHSSPHGVNAVLWQHQLRIGQEIGRGEAQFVAQAPAGPHGPRQRVGMAAEPGGGLHLPGLDQSLQVGGGDGHAVDDPGRDHVAAQAAGCAPAPQGPGVARAEIAEAVVPAADQVGRSVVPDQQRQKGLPGQVHKFLGKGQHLHGLHAVEGTDQPDPVLHRSQQPPVLAGRAVEGQGQRAPAPRGGQLRRPAQQIPVSQMDAVKKA